MFNVASQIVYVLALKSLLNMPKKCATPAMFYIAMDFASIFYHGIAFFMGAFGFMSLGSFNLFDRVFAQGLMVVFGLMFMIIYNIVLRDCMIILSIFTLGLLMIVADIYWFSICMFVPCLAVSITLHWRKWASAVRTVTFWLAVFFTSISLILYFMWEYSPILHSFWHMTSAISLDLWTQILAFHFYGFIDSSTGYVMSKEALTVGTECFDEEIAGELSLQKFSERWKQNAKNKQQQQQSDTISQFSPTKKIAKKLKKLRSMLYF